jgi:phage baseplate assembly protein W
MTKGFNVSEPLSTSAIDGAFSMLVDPKEAIKQNLRFLILTAPGERIRIPDFGVGIRNYLFENYTPQLEAQIINKIQEQARIYMPYIAITDIIFNTENIDNSQIGLAIEYSIDAQVTISDFLILEITI